MNEATPPSVFIPEQGIKWTEASVQELTPADAHRLMTVAVTRNDLMLIRWCTRRILATVE